MMSHDYRIVVNEKELKIGMTEINLGMTIPDGMLAPLDAKLSRDVMRDVCLFGKIINPEESLERKVIDKIVSKEKLLEEGIKMG